METAKKNKNLECDVLFGDGTSRRVLITSGAVDLVKRAAMVTPFLFEGTGINPLSAEVSNIVAISRADHAILHRGESVLTAAETQAIFRLGQMGMRASIADMLEDLADGTQGEVCTTLIDAAQRVRELKLCDTVKEETCEAD